MTPNQSIARFRAGALPSVQDDEVDRMKNFLGIYPYFFILSHYSRCKERSKLESFLISMGYLSSTREKHEHCRA